MRFCDLFISYKIRLKNIKSKIPFTKLPTYRKIILIIFVACAILSSIILVITHSYLSCIPIVIGLLSIMIFFIIDSTKSNLKMMLNEHYAPYSKQRMDMVIDILNQYNIDISNAESIDRLIEEAKLAQLQCDYFAPIKKPLKALVGLIIPIIAYIAKKVGETTSVDNIIFEGIVAIILILLTFSLIFSLVPIIRTFFYKDYTKYESLIYDLRQLKIFYTSK